MQVKFKPTEVIKTRLGIQRYGPTHKYFAERCRHYMNAKYVPERNRALVTTSYVDNTCNIVYPQPYAHYHYIGKLYVDPKYKKGAFYNENYGYWSRKDVKKEATDINLNYSKTGAGPYWDKKMVSADMPTIEKEVQELIRRGGK